MLHHYALILSLVTGIAFGAQELQPSPVDAILAKSKLDPVPEEHFTGEMYKAVLQAKPTAEILAKAEDLLKKSAPSLQDLEMEKENLIKVVQLVESLRTETVPWPKESLRSILIFRDIYLPLSLHIYRYGNAYILLSIKDPKRTAGGFKVFSRSIDYDTGKLFAGITFSHNNKNPTSVRMLERELRTMELQKISTYGLGFRDIDIAGLGPNSKRHLISLQTQLYDGDANALRARDLREFVEFAIKAARAVAELHQRGVVHRDIKPGNFLIKRYLDGLGVALIDYGLSEQETTNQFGVNLCGTPGFAAPELCLNKVTRKNAPSFRFFTEGVRADTFALGMTYHLMYHHGVTEAYNRSTKLPPSKDSVAPNGAVKRARRYADHWHSMEPNPALAKTHQGRIKYALELLIWKMLDPDPDSRIELDAVRQTLQGIQNLIFE